VSKKTAPPIVTLYQHGIDVTGYPRDPDSWPPFRSPLFEVTEEPGGVRTECIALPVPHGPALRRALAFGLSEAERAAIHEFLGNEQRQLERTIRRDSEIESGAYLDGMTVSDEDDAQASLF
jgi:hypothetical protein